MKIMQFGQQIFIETTEPNQLKIENSFILGWNHLKLEL